MSVQVSKLPSAFVWRRVQSLFGLWLVLFLTEHLLTNSQAALMFGENGMGFIRAVNFLKNLPYLHVIEISLLGIPILVHMIWGIKYLFTSKQNSLPSSGKKPSLTKYPRNHAYTFQRWTSWIVLFGIILHIGYMRFYHYPVEANPGDCPSYFVRVEMDKGLYTVSERLGVELFDQDKINRKVEAFKERERENVSLRERAREEYHIAPTVSPYDESTASLLDENQEIYLKQKWIDALTSRPLKKNQVMAESDNFGTATLLVVRDSFSHVTTGILYTIFVLATVFHAFNGLWTFLISWGAVLRVRTQSQMVNVCMAIMLVVAFLGMAAIWGTYFINLQH